MTQESALNLSGGEAAVRGVGAREMSSEAAAAVAAIKSYSIDAILGLRSTPSADTGGDKTDKMFHFFYKKKYL